MLRDGEADMLRQVCDADGIVLGTSPSWVPRSNGCTRTSAYALAHLCCILANRHGSVVKAVQLIAPLVMLAIEIAYPIICYPVLS